MESNYNKKNLLSFVFCSLIRIFATYYANNSGSESVFLQTKTIKL